MPSLAGAIKTALKSEEGSTLSRSQLRREIASVLEEHGDKQAQQEAFASALASLVEKGSVTCEGKSVAWTRVARKRKNSGGVSESAAPTDCCPSSATAVAEPRALREERPEKKARKSEVAAVVTTGDDAAVAAAAEEFRRTHQISVVSGDAASLPAPFASFDDAIGVFGAQVVAALKNSGFVTPSPIQAQSWPVAVRGDNLVAVAKTGSGKTLAFALPTLCALKGKSAGKGPLALVLAPTRELATQIEEVVVKFGKVVGVSSTCIYGGVPKGPQAKSLRSKPALVVATPGRMVDLLQDKATELGDAGVVILDEADRMLDMGFQPQIAEIFEALPPADKRQLLLFTATWQKSMKKLAAAYLNGKPLHISIGCTEELTANTAITQIFFEITDDEKDNKLLREVYAMADDAKVVVFVNTKRRADNLAKLLWENGYGCAAIHGDKQQGDREKALKSFRSAEWPILVATDVAARGLDIDNVTHVVNFDMARDVESYVHRIGRTGRAGKSGVSITFWNPDYDKECAPALAKIAQDAGQEVPSWLAKHAAGPGKGKLWSLAALDKVKVA